MSLAAEFVRDAAGYAAAVTDEGFATPEEVARGDIPPQYVIVLGTLVVGDDATVWMLTNDRPPYEPYTVGCHREHGRWVADMGICGLSDVNGMGFPPDVVLARADGYFATS